MTMKASKILICFVFLLLLGVRAEARKNDGESRQQAPLLEVVGKCLLYPDATYDLRVQHRSLTAVEVRWLRLEHDDSVCVRRDTLFFHDTTAIELKEDTFHLLAPSIGRYIMELQPCGFATSPEPPLRLTVNVSRFKVFPVALSRNKAEVIVTDAQSGRPIKDATVSFKERNGGQKQTAVTDAYGKAYVSYSGKVLNGQIKATKVDDRYMSWSDARASYSWAKNEETSAAFPAASDSQTHSFSVTLEVSDDLTSSDYTLLVTGRAINADGLPVCGAKVTIRTALVHQFTQVFSRSKASVLDITTTDADGRFFSLVPLFLLPDGGFSDGMMQVMEAEVLDNSGDTQYARLNIPRTRPNLSKNTTEKQDSTDFLPARISCVNDTVAPNAPARVRISCPDDSITLFYMLFCEDELLDEGVHFLKDTVRDYCKSLITLISEAPSGGTDAKRSELCERNACGGPASAAARSITTKSLCPAGLRTPPFAAASVLDFVYDTIPANADALLAEYFFVWHGKLMRHEQRLVRSLTECDSSAVPSLSFSLPDYTIRLQYNSEQPDSAMRTTSKKQYSLLSPVDMSTWGIPAGNYSSITPIGDNLYAVTDDKAETSGFFVFFIEQDSITGQVTRIENRGFRGDSSMRKNRDAEGIAYSPHDSLIWISGEADQRVLAHKRTGQYAGKELFVPDCFSIDFIVPNYGFEALCFDSQNHLFWAMTENTLRADGLTAAPGTNISAKLRLQSFNISGSPQASYVYQLDLPQETVRGTDYAFGAVALCPAENGNLWVMEREINVPDKRLNAVTHLKIYEINPFCGKMPLPKRLIINFSTTMKLVRPQFANYEGLCKGIRLADGRRTWLLISDSQGGYGNKLCHLRDLLRVFLEP